MGCEQRPQRRFNVKAKTRFNSFIGFLIFINSSAFSAVSAVKKYFLMMQKKIIFITGGARSGKSQFALKLAQEFPGPKAYLATAQALDNEMAERIREHKNSRPKDWQTLEEPLYVAGALKKQGDHFSLILLDCLTLWISNLLMAEWSEKRILREGDRLLKVCQELKCSLIIVSNEVGLGIVPDNPKARIFRDLSGLVNQKAARKADEVYFLISGLPQQLKKRQEHSAKGKKNLVKKASKVSPPPFPPPSEPCTSMVQGEGEGFVVSSAERLG